MMLWRYSAVFIPESENWGSAAETDFGVLSLSLAHNNCS